MRTALELTVPAFSPPSDPGYRTTVLANRACRPDVAAGFGELKMELPTPDKRMMRVGRSVAAA